MDLLEAKNRKGNYRHPWELARYQVMLSLIRKTFKDRPIKNVWDVGCGDTFFVETLSKDLPDSRFSAVDIEFTPELIEEYSQQLPNDRIELFVNVEDIQSKEEVDLLFLMDVIEHIEKDIDFLEWLLSFPMITPNTCFVITVPAFQSLFCSHDRFLLHYRRYTNASLREAVETAGLEVKEIGYFFTSLLIPRQLQVWRERRQEKRKDKLEIEKEDSTGLVEWTGGKGKTNLLKNILVTDFRFSQFFRMLGLKIPGLSNYVICYPKSAS